jgi:hypothetical protein
LRLLVIAACGFDAEEAARRSAHLDLDRLVPNTRVVVVDGDAYYSRPARASPTASASSAICCIRRPSRIQVCR